MESALVFRERGTILLTLARYFLCFMAFLESQRDLSDSVKNFSASSHEFCGKDRTPKVQPDFAAPGEIFRTAFWT